MLSASGSSTLRIHSTTDPTFPLVQSLEKVHKLGCHHITTSANGKVAASTGFGGETKIWTVQGGHWSERRTIKGARPLTKSLALLEDPLADQDPDGAGPGEIWAIALSEDGQYLATTSFDGRINVWDDLAGGAKIREFETKGSFGMSIDLVLAL